MVTAHSALVIPQLLLFSLGALPGSEPSHWILHIRSQIIPNFMYHQIDMLRGLPGSFSSSQSAQRLREWRLVQYSRDDRFYPGLYILFPLCEHTACSLRSEVILRFWCSDQPTRLIQFGFTPYRAILAMAKDQ